MVILCSPVGNFSFGYLFIVTGCITINSVIPLIQIRNFADWSANLILAPTGYSKEFYDSSFDRPIILFSVQTSCNSCVLSLGTHTDLYFRLFVSMYEEFLNNFCSFGKLVKQSPSKRRATCCMDASESCPISRLINPASFVI